MNNASNDEFRHGSYLNFQLALVLKQCENLSSDHTLFFTAVISEFSYECNITVMTRRDDNVIIGSLWGTKTSKPDSGMATSNTDFL